ncbi:hypothetical protein HYH02_003912 [Chlamydomonas schloesseri]|uniref:U5 small nuclear ribonucleoprotein TSSC4 n=1 Tax=Chlamydomonas schloesseri TaxID=2026947 RepID=A0A835WR09_9CHLO|nr:hypothetical protein HYH02_003912 [Chlamydomonas schloesseri]|eukprot:KAG2451306.1 hypothetical protein HYH02_003912 [Chlamydomonas schloesseri]
MSKGVPISQRPELAGASLQSRLDAVFGALGGPAPAPVTAQGLDGAQEAPAWSLRSEVQPFRSGQGIEDYKYSSDEEDEREGLKPVMPSRLVDSDDEEEAGGCTGRKQGAPQADPDADDGGEAAEQRAAREKERLRASLASRRAFEAEAEEDEYDRFAAGSYSLRNRGADPDKPPGSTEVPLDSAWERMHARLEQQRQRQAAGDGAADGAAPTAMEEDAPPPAPSAAGEAGAAASADGSAEVEKSSAAGAQRKRARAGDGLNAGARLFQAAAAAAGARRGATADGSGAATETEGGAGVATASVSGRVHASPAVEGEAVAAKPRQRGGRRVQWADSVAPDRPDEEADAGRGDGGGEAGGGGRDGGGSGRGRGGRGGRVRLDWLRRGFVPDHVRNPHKYTVYTFDEPITVGGGDRGNGRNGHSNGSRRRGDPGSDAAEAADMRQALADVRNALAASEAAEHDPERVETTFGSGIAFRPRTQRQQQQKQQEGDGKEAAGEEEAGQMQGRDKAGEARPGRGAAPAATAGLRRGAAFADPDADGDADGGAGTDAAEGAGAAGAGRGSGGSGVRGGGRRHLRARRGAEEDEAAAGAMQQS